MTQLELSLEGSFLGGASRGRPGLAVLSWSMGFTHPTTPAKPVIDMATHAPLTITRYADRITPALLKHCWTGRELTKATLTSTITDAAGAKSTTLRLVLEGVTIASYETGGTTGDAPVETIGLLYRKITVSWSGDAQGEPATSYHDVIQQIVG